MPAKLKEFNWQVLAVGKPGSGKSWWLRHHTWEVARSVGAYVVMHDPTGSASLDRSIPTRSYPSVDAARRGIAELGGRVVHILDVPDGLEVLNFGIQLAAASMQRAGARDPKKRCPCCKPGEYHPVIVLIDEAVGAEGIRAHGLDDEWMSAQARRRHLGIGIGLTAQSVFFCHRSLLTLSTQVEIFALMDPADAKRLTTVGLPLDVALQLPQLPDRAHYTLVNGRVTAFTPAAGTQRPRAPARARAA